MRIILFFLSFGLYYVSFTQTSMESLMETYADQSMVVLSKVDSLVINSDEDIVLHHSITKQVLRPIYADVLNTSISYDDFSPVNDIHAEVSRLKEDGSVEVSDKVNMSYQNSMISGIFYHDNKVINIAYPFYSPGTISKLSYSKKVTQPHFINKFIFSEGYPTLHSKYVLNCHKSIDIGYTVFNDANNQVKFSKVDNGDFWLYTWETNEMDAWDVYSYREVLQNVPHLSLRIKSVQKNNQEIVYLKDMDAFYNWLYDFVEPIIEPSEEMDSLASTIVDGLSTEVEKLKAVYDWVQSNITYVAFEDGYNGFIPRKPTDVCRKKYGDCKDMSLLLYTLLESAGIDASVVWIGTDDIPYKIEEILAPAAFNHMIACADIDDKRYWLDATARYLDFEVTSPFTQGQEGLVAKSRDEYEIVELPVTELTKNQVIDSMRLSIKDKQVIGKRKYTCTGYKKLDFIYDIYRFDEEKKEDISEYFTIGNNSYHQSNFYIDKKEDERNAAASMTADFTVDNYVRSFGQKVLINPLLLKFSNGMKFDTTIINNRNFEYNSIRKEHVSLELGELNIQNLPENMSIENDLLKYTVNYKVEDGQLLIDRVFEIRKYYLTKKDAPKWNDAIQQIKEQETDNLVLVKS